MAAPQLVSLTTAQGRYLAEVEIRILGPLEVIADGVARHVGGPRERELLALLALSPGRVLSSDRLIDGLWGEELPANPANALQAVVSRLRRAIGSATIVTQPPGYRLNVEPEAVDAERFRAMVAAAGEEPDPAERGRRYGAALQLWRGDALADFALHEFAQREIAALDELRLLALEGRIAADLDAGAAAELVPELEQLVLAHPLRESLRASQMRALYRSGRQADALRAYAAARHILGGELGIEPGLELRTLEQAILEQDPGLAAGETAGRATGVASHLPARLSSFIGRTDDLAKVQSALADSRLVTLTGAGGAGKTSLAIEAARSLAADYVDGVWLVELGSVAEPERVVDAVMASLQLELGGMPGRTGDATPQRVVVEYLRHRVALLVVDNCEHLVDAVAETVSAVLLSCPEVDVLATSRERLGIPGELLWRVPPLSLGNGEASSDAVALFLERARAVAPSFDPANEELAAVIDICRRIDGMPLAIELAAARTRTLSVNEIAARLRDGIDVLRGGPRHASVRQQTLEATIDWSFRLLAPADRDMFARLSVFQGSFPLAAAQAVDALDWTPSAVLDSIERLIDGSMIASVGTAVPRRYRMLETLRVYGASRLDEARLTDEVMTQLLEYLLATLADAEDGLRGPEQLAWLDRIDADLGTLRHVLDWSEQHVPSAGLRLAGMLGWFWYLRGSGPEARERLGRMLQAAEAEADISAVGRARFFRALHDPHIEEARSDFEAARDAYDAAGDVRGVVHALSMMAAWGFDRDETHALIDQAASLSVEHGLDWEMALISFLRAGVAAVANDIAGSARHAEDAAARFAALEDRWGLGYSQYSLGVARRALGDYPGAKRALLAALDHARPMRLRREMAPVLSELASIAMMQGELDEATVLLAQARDYADQVPFAGSQGMVRNAQGRLARLRGDYDEAERLHREAVALYEMSRNPGGLAYSLSCLGCAEMWAGDLGAAAEHHLRALRHARATEDLFAVAFSLEGMGAMAIAAGGAEPGVTLIEAGLALRRQAGVPLPAGERLDTESALAVARGMLSRADFDAARRRGRRLDAVEAIELASRYRLAV